MKSGKKFLNYSFAAVASTHLLGCTRDMVIATLEMFEDVKDLYLRIKNWVWTPMVT